MIVKHKQTKRKRHCTVRNLAFCRSCSVDVFAKLASTIMQNVLQRCSRRLAFLLCPCSPPCTLETYVWLFAHKFNNCMHESRNSVGTRCECVFVSAVCTSSVARHVHSQFGRKLFAICVWTWVRHHVLHVYTENTEEQDTDHPTHH